MTFREKLRDLIKDTGLSQKAFAEDSGILYYTIVGLTRPDGGANSPAIQTLIKLAEYFNVTVDNIIKNVEFELVDRTSKKKRGIKKTIVRKKIAVKVKGNKKKVAKRS